MTPVMVALIVAMHAWSSPDSKTFSLMALVFMVLMTGLTCSLHFVILTLGRQPVGCSLSLRRCWPSFPIAQRRTSHCNR